jgi:D-serine deaminase-like pyridoxal phosphate-dependent protein
VTTALSALQKRLDRATAHLEASLAVVDLDAFDDNAAALTALAGGRPIRLASKSVRCANAAPPRSLRSVRTPIWSS